MIDGSDLIKEATSSQAWANIVRAPARFVHPLRIVACYGGAIALDLAKELQRSDRLQQQLAILLMDHFKLPLLTDAGGLDDADLKLLAASFETIDDLALFAGAIFWSHVFASEIRTSEVSDLKRRFGERVFQAAIANRDLASNLESPADLGELETLMASDGLCCMASWHEALADPLRPWARLKCANDTLPSQGWMHGTLGLAIMRRLATTLPPLERDGAQ